MVKGKTPLIISSLLGLCAFGIAWSAIKKEEQRVRTGWNPVPVVVAAVDIPEGAVITMEMVRQRSIPDQFVTSSVVKPDSANYIVGQRVLVALQAGDPLVWTQFENSRASERLSNKIQERARAFTIAASTTTSVGGWVHPNDHIDVLGTFKDPESGEPVALTLLQNVVVLATGRLTGTTNVNLLPESERHYSDVSLLVLPQEAEALMLAQELGSLSLSLRTENDVSVMAERRTTTIKTLFEGERLARIARDRPSGVVIIRGSTTQTEHSP